MESAKLNKITGLMEAVQYFSDPMVCLETVAKAKWPDGQPQCPKCGGKKVSFVTTRRVWTCLGCRKQFSVKVGTVFEDSPIGLDKWLVAMWMLANCQDGVSSYEVGRVLRVTHSGRRGSCCTGFATLSTMAPSTRCLTRLKPTRPLSAAKRETCMPTSAKKRFTAAARKVRPSCSVCWIARLARFMLRLS